MADADWLRSAVCLYRLFVVWPFSGERQNDQGYIQATVSREVKVALLECQSVAWELVVGYLASCERPIDIAG